MSVAHAFVVLSAFISVFGAYAYIRDTLVGKTKPNRVSWLMWAIAPLIGTAAALSANADIWATVRVFLAGFIPLLIFLSSFINRKSYWHLTKFDIACGICSLFALIIWAGIDSPRAAIVLAALADTFAAIPTLVKAWKHPETETGTTYIASLVSLVLILPSIPAWNIENAAFQIQLIIINILLVCVVYRNKQRKVIYHGQA